MYSYVWKPSAVHNICGPPMLGVISCVLSVPLLYTTDLSGQPGALQIRSRNHCGVQETLGDVRCVNNDGYGGHTCYVFKFAEKSTLSRYEIQRLYSMRWVHKRQTVVKCYVVFIYSMNMQLS